MLSAMVVEDNESFRELIRDTLLSQHPSVKVVEAGSGEEALEKLGTYPPDLVFMDIRLPGQNGLEITRKIKASHQDIPVVILTNHDLPEYREAAITCGANCFIGKDSLKWEEILTLVKCHLEAKHNGRKPACLGLYK